MTFVLIIILAGAGSAVGSAEFSSKEACEAAGRAVAQARADYTWAGKALTVCAPKG